MNHLNFFKSFHSKTIDISEKKSFLHNSFLDLRYDVNYNIGITIALSYYATISVVATAIDIICKEFENITPVIKNIKNPDIFIKEDPMLDLLAHPNSDETGTAFFGKLSRYFKITGNSFMVATGNIKRPPLEVYAINPKYITIEKSSDDMFPKSYTYVYENGSVVFNRISDKGRFRYIDKEEDKELWHIKKFNPYDTLWGLSELNSVYLEINQFFQSNQHNLNLLRKGIRSSGILSYDGELTQDQRDNIKAQISADKEGSNNAGKIFFFDGSKMDFKELSQSMKDMDFKDLKKDIENTIYTRLEIPLPSVSTDNQKFDNMFAAKLSLWDEAVIPMTNFLFQELSLFLMPRFKKDPKKEKLTYNIFDINVLRERELQNVERLSKTNILTKNELRAMLTREKINGGDVIYQPISFVPLGTSPVTLEGEKSLEKVKLLKKELAEIKYSNGDNVYCLEDKSKDRLT